MKLDIAKIEKALFDISIQAEASNPRFLTNSEKSIQNEIQESLRTYDSYDIAVSYVVLSGLQRLLDDLNNKPGSRFITTTDGFVTSPEALERLLQLHGTEVRVFVPQNRGVGFHAKTYMFKKQDDVRLIVGSANISNRAFGSVHESSIVTDFKGGGELYKRYQENFESIWQLSKPLTNEFINEYREKYYAYKYSQSSFEFEQKSKEPQPNLMQEAALEKLKEIREQGQKRALIVASTGSGKTYLSAFDVKQSGAQKVLFVVHNRTILRKSISTFKTVFKSQMRALELKTSNLNLINSFNFIFATPQTFGKYAQDYPKDFFDYIVIDEAHHSPANTHRKIIDHFEPKFLLGMTATPDRPDAKIKAKDVYEVFNHVIPYEIRLHDAIESNLISPFNYFGIGEDLADEKVKVEDKVNTIMKNVEKYGYFGRKLKALAFVDTIVSAEQLAEEFRNQGIHAVSVSGETDPDLVDVYLEELGSDDGALKIIVSVNKLNEGIDVPEINSIIMLRKTESAIIYIQQLGRGLRLSDPNKFVTVLDFVGNYAGSFAVIQGLMDKVDATGYELKRDLLSTPTMLSNIQLDEISRNRIYESIDSQMPGTMTTLKNIFKSYVEKWGNIPTMYEYSQASDKMDEILLHFDSFQELKSRLNYIQPSERYLDFFRHISQGILQSGTEKQIQATFDLITKRKAIIDDEYLRNYLIGEFKTPVTHRNKFFKVKDEVVIADFDDLLQNAQFKKDFDEFVEYISHNIKNQNRVLLKNYRRLDIPFMASRSSLATMLEGQFFKDGIFWCMPSLMRKWDVDAKKKFENELVDSKHFLYITKNDVHAKKVITGEFRVEFFIRHRSSPDSYLTYIGTGKLVKNFGLSKPDEEHSYALMFELENELPKWMVDDYQCENWQEYLDKLND